ncbi:MAG: hypoxanthine phosphoribosyltransferase [Rhodoglobus sp.]|nr:hypoxanthine phosphoribosyltransferase [Rhodoglobus sp.]
MELADVADDITEVLFTESQIHDKVAELARRVERDYVGERPLLVGVLKGAVMIMADVARELKMHVDIDFMAVSSYGVSTESSGVVRILKDLDADLSGRHVIIVEDIIDSGLTLAWLRANLETRSPASLEILALLRKPDAAKVEVDVKYLGFDIPNAFVVGYGLDYAERYRNLSGVAVLAPHVYS